MKEDKKVINFVVYFRKFELSYLKIIIIIKLVKKILKTNLFW